MKHLSKSLACILLLSLFASVTCADDTSLSPELIKKIEASFEMDPHTRAMTNAVTNNDISKLALNREILQDHNEIFSNKIETKPITNQKQSGRCWLFAGLNTLKPAVMEKYNLKEFEFSQNYLAFWDKMEKANTFLENIIIFKDRDTMDRHMEFYLRNPIPDGGYWENVVNLVEKYGVVPKDVMEETNSSGNTSLMNRLLARKLRADAVILRRMNDQKQSVKKLRTEKEKMLAEVYKMLVINLGQPPKEFIWRFEDANSVVSGPNTYTPQQFYTDIVGLDLREYVNIGNDPSKDYRRHYEIDGTKNFYDGENLHFANVDMQTLKDITLKTVLDEQPVWFGADVGKDQDKNSGIMAIGLNDYDSIYQLDFKMTKAQRSLYRDSAPTHAMVFTGVDIIDGKPVKWLVENSWGDDIGSKGFWTMYDDWFDLNIYDCVINKKYVPDDVLKIFDQKAILMPPWDPMYSIGN